MPKSKQPVLVQDDDGAVYELVPVKQTAHEDFDEEVVDYGKKRTKSKTPPSKDSKQSSKAKGSKSTKATKKPSSNITKSSKSSAKNTKQGPKAAKQTKQAKKAAKPKIRKPKKVVEDDGLIEEKDDGQIAEEAAEEQKKMYRKYKRFCTRYEKKEAQKKFDSLADWKKADKLWTSAASILVRHKALDSKKGDLTAHLPDAVGPLRARGEAQFLQGKQLIDGLIDEHLALFWNAQIRNKGVTKYEDLITKKTYAERLKEIVTGQTSDVQIQDVQEGQGERSEQSEQGEHTEQSEQMEVADAAETTTQMETVQTDETPSN